MKQNKIYAVEFYSVLNELVNVTSKKGRVLAGPRSVTFRRVILSKETETITSVQDQTYYRPTRTSLARAQRVCNAIIEEADGES
jgi:hypothetical protein